ncbi:MAG: BNR repeat-containing protein [Gemmatimonadetes bacterium]|nr:BNR repeat-containing protein [Gemmatimonadota bacterium]
MSSSTLSVYSSLSVAMVWSGHPVGFDLLTHGDVQFIAFYNAERKITVGMRKIDEETWIFAHPEGIWLENRGRLSSEVGWDSHNSLTMAIDDDGHIHLCGNMHVDPLIYFRTTRPLDVTSFERIDFMVGKNEDRCTYPVFMRGPNNELIFRFRDGSSGNGVDFYNVYDVQTKTWHRMLSTPLLDGLDRMNAYARMPEKGPDGIYHMVWIWRDTPDCATNHNISYARSPDLISWETGGGNTLTLPITIESGATVDPVPPGGGLINMTQSLGFDDQKRPVISYHKHDENGYTQAYCARLENGEWVFYKVSDWTYRWEFGGGGSIGAEIRLGGVEPEADGGLSMSYWHIKEGQRIWKLHPQTLEVIGTYPPPDSEIPDELEQVTSDYPGMTVNLRGARGKGTRPDEQYILRWETLDRNRDRPREKIPPPSELRLYILRQK